MASLLNWPRYTLKSPGERIEVLMDYSYVVPKYKVRYSGVAVHRVTATFI